MKVEALNGIKARLRVCCDRLAVLVPELPGLGAELDFLSGALFSLLQAARHEHRERSDPLSENYLDNLVRRLKNMRHGSYPTKSKYWLAGYFFNSALMRLDAIKEHTQKAISALPKEQQRGRTKMRKVNTLFEKIHDEVKDLKHFHSGQWKKRKVTWATALDATEGLLEFIEGNKDVLKNHPRLATKAKSMSPGLP